VLYAKADLQGVTSMALIPGANLCISVRNPLYDSEVREKVVIESDELLEERHVPLTEQDGDQSGDRDRREPPHHFSLTWDGEKSKSTIRVLGSEDMEAEAAKTSGKKKGQKRNQSRRNVEVREMNAKDSGEFVPMLALECQGIEPFAFHSMGGEFRVTNQSDTFDQVDLSGGDWSEFDMATGSTSISKFETKFV